MGDSRQALHLYNADALRRGMEPDPVQLVRLYAPRVRHELHRDAARADSRQLQAPPHLLLGPALLRGGAPARVQALLAGAEGQGSDGSRSVSVPSCAVLASCEAKRSFPARNDEYWLY